MSIHQHAAKSGPDTHAPFSRSDAPVEPAMLTTGLDQQPAAIGVGPVALSIFDQLSIGVVLLDRSAKVLFANASAQSLSGNGDMLRINANIATLAAGQTRRLSDLVRSVLDGGTSMRSVSLPARGSGRPLLVVASSIAATMLDRSEVRNLRRAAAVLLICDPDRPTEISESWMAQAYGLTVAEARVALAVGTGATISSAARRLKVSTNTVKTHLGRVYEKTGTASKAELAHLMATIGVFRCGGS